MFRAIILFLILINLLASCSDSSTEHKRDSEDRLDDSKDVSFKLPPLPDSLYFAGKLVLLDNFDVRERLDKEIIVNTFYHSSTIQSFKRAARFFPELEKILGKNGIPLDFKYLCLIESGLTQATSPSGAKGFWQFMPETAKEYGLKLNSEIDERFNVEKSTMAACHYLTDANSKFNDWLLTAASYNRGVAGIERDLESQYVSKYEDLHLNEETSRYVFRILALKLIFENPEAYGFNTIDFDLYQPIPSKEVVLTESVDDIALWAKNHKTNYRMIKLLNPWLLTNKITIHNDSIILLLPA